MDMTGLKVLVLTPVVAALDLSDASDLGKAGIVGLLVLAVIAVWRDSGKRQDKLEKIIDRNSGVIGEDAETRRDTNKILVELKEVIIKCKGPK